MTQVYMDPSVGGDGKTYSDDKNPSTGLAGGGYLKRFIACLVNIVAIANYVKNTATGLVNSNFTAVRFSATGNITTSGTQTVDGGTPANGDRILCPLQSSGGARGIYIYNSAGAWTRSTDSDVAADWTNGKAIYVAEGTENAGCTFIHSTTGAIILGTTILNFIRMPSLLKANIWSAVQTFIGAVFFNGNVTLGDAAADTITINGTSNYAAAQNEAYATLASSATPNIWGVAANVIDYTGTNIATGFPAAPQPGATRRLVCAAACGFAKSANMLIEGDADYTASAGDEITVTAITTTIFRLRIKKANGSPVGCDVTNPIIRGILDLVGGRIKFSNTGYSSDSTTIDCYREYSTTNLAATSGNALPNSPVSSISMTTQGNVVHFNGVVYFPTQTNSNPAEVFFGVPGSYPGSVPHFTPLYSRVPVQIAESDESTCVRAVMKWEGIGSVTITFQNSSGAALTLTAMSGNYVYFAGTYITATS